MLCTCKSSFLLIFWEPEIESASQDRSRLALWFSTRCVRSALLCWTIFAIKSIFSSSLGTSYFQSMVRYGTSALVIVIAFFSSKTSAVTYSCFDFIEIEIL